ncbi:hypothetical protein QOT17_004591 [Balamuthia mandrillaris]
MEEGHLWTIATLRDYAFVCHGHGSPCSSSSMLLKCRSPACPSNADEDTVQRWLFLPYIPQDSILRNEPLSTFALSVGRLPLPLAFAQVTTTTRLLPF